MIALDSSALVAFALNEPEGPLFGSQLRMRRCLVGAPTLLETTLVLSNKPRFDEAGFWRGIERLKNIEVVPFDERCLQAARAAFGRYGKGRHPAGLNFGDCMAYAVAKVHGAPLLFKGRDFLATDIEPAVRP